MTLRTLIKKMDKGYYDEGILLGIYDHPERDSGDGLATFIVNETRDLAGKKRKLTEKDLNTIRAGLNKAIFELNDTINAF